jgi:hypothetical protein
MERQAGDGKRREMTWAALGVCEESRGNWQLATMCVCVLSIYAGQKCLSHQLSYCSIFFISVSYNPLLVRDICAELPYIIQ